MCIRDRVYDMLAQGIFGTQGPVKDVAIVNLLLEKDPPEAAFVSQLSGEIDHMLIWNATLVDQTFNFRNSAQLSRFDVRNGVFAGLATDNPDHDSIVIESAHTKKLAWNQKQPLGANPTTGDPAFVNEEVDDYRLSPQSPGHQTGVLCPGVPADVDGIPWGDKPSRGAFAADNPGKSIPPVSYK